MNPKCPECQTELPEDFGIVTCTNCGAVCSVDLDGNAEVQSEVSASADDQAQDLEDVQEEDSFEDSSLEAQSDHEFGDSLEGVAEDSGDSEDLFENEDNGFGEEESTAVDFDAGGSVDDSLDEEESSGFDDGLTDLEDLSAEVDADQSDYQEESDIEDSNLDQEDDLSVQEYDNDESEEFSSEEESEADEESEVEDQPLVQSEPLSSEGFFSNLELFTEQLEPQDHHHTYYQLHVEGFETEADLQEVLDLTLDDRLGLIKESLNFDATMQSFIIPKISFLRLIALHKRLSTLGYIEMQWNLTEDQSDIADADPSEYEDDEATEVGEFEPEVEAEPEGDDTLFEEVDESDY